MNEIVEKAKIEQDLREDSENKAREIEESSKNYEKRKTKLTSKN
jgi:hypothetical protein